MVPITWGMWPIGVGLAVVVVGAVLLKTSGRVPNALTLPAVMLGWGLAAVGPQLGLGGGLVTSLLASAAALLICLPFYNAAELGAGCVKAQMAFGAWAGAALSLPSALAVTAVTTLLALGLTWLGLRICTACREPQSSEFYLFPAQLTFAAGTLAGLAVCLLTGWLH